MKERRRSMLLMAGMALAVFMTGLQAFGSVASTDQVYVSPTDTRNMDQETASELWSSDGSWASYMRFPIIGGTVDGIAAADITSASLDVWVKKNGDYDMINVYVLNDSESYFEADGIQVVSTNGVTNFYDYVGLSETAWSSGGATNQNMLSTNLCHGPFFSITNAGWDTHLTLLSTGRRTPGSPGGTDDRDSALGSTIGQAFPIPITELDAFKDAITNDTNNELTLLLVGSLGEDSTRLEVASIYDTSRPAPALTVLSGPDTTVSTVTNLIVKSARDAAVRIKWGYYFDADLQGFNVYRSETQGGPYTQIATLTEWANAYNDTNVVNDTTYYYYVGAFDDESPANESTGNEVEATPVEDLIAPDTPTNVVAEAGNAIVTLTWNASQDDAGAIAYYNVYRSETSGSYGAALTNVTATTFADLDVSNGTTYYYKVTAVDDSLAGNESPLGSSAEVSATPASVSGTVLVDVVFGSDNDGLGGFTASAPQTDQTWTTLSDGVRMYSQNVGTLNTSLLLNYPLTDKAFGASYTLEGTLVMEQGYADDNNRTGFYLFGDDSDLGDGATWSTNSAGGEDEQEAIGIIYNSDDSSTGGPPGNNAQDNLSLRVGIDYATLASQLRDQTVPFAQDLFGTEIKFTADLVYTNIGGTNVIVVTATMTQEGGYQTTTSTLLNQLDYPGDYFGFVNRSRARNYDGDPDPTGASRDNPWSMKYKTFKIIKTRDGIGGEEDTPYEAYLKSIGLTGTELPGGDEDNDGLLNLYEYGIGGNANNASLNGTAPVLVKSGGAYYYVYPERTNDVTLTYSVETTTNLLDSGSWTASGTTLAGSAAATPPFVTTSNAVDTVTDEKFIRLKIVQ